MALQARLAITGRVQGVGYRDWAVATGQRLGLSGWVRNRTDGSVEAVVRGQALRSETFIAGCHAGPPLARVTAVDAASDDALDLEPGFRQLPTD